MARRKLAVWLGLAVAAACAVGALAWLGRPGEPDARALRGNELLANLRGYLKVGRVEEAAQVLASIENISATAACLDQARYEVARAYVDGGRGELAIVILDKVSLHDRSFDFQRAILREKIRGLYAFFFDAFGDLHTPAQLDAYILHSRLNPDERLRPRNPVGFTDSNVLIDYFQKVAKQLEDVLEIQGLPRATERALAEGYDAIQILLYGRGDIDYARLKANLATSPTSASARTVYLLGSQHFAEADYDRAFAAWGELLASHRQSDEALRAFEKTFELFEGRRALGNAFVFWPLQEPVWIASAAAQEPFKTRAAEVASRIASHRDVAGYSQKVTVNPPPPVYEAKKRDVFRQSADVTSAGDDEEPPVIADDGLEIPEEARLVLTRDHSLGWRLQTEFREFFIRRTDAQVLAPSEKKLIELRSSYHGEVRFSALRFPDGRGYQDFKKLPPAAAAATAAALPEAKSWTRDLGPMSGNGQNVTVSVEVPISEQGFYLIVARARYVPVVAVVQMAVVADKVLTWSSPTGVLYRVVNRETGAPVPGARLHGSIAPEYRIEKMAPQLHDGSRAPEFVRGLGQGFHGVKRDELTTDSDEFLAGYAEGQRLRGKYDFGPQSFEVRTDADGLARLAVPEKWKGQDCLVRAELGELGGVCPVESRCQQPGEGTSWRALFYAERPIFMPGEKARLKGILRRQGSGGLSLPERRETEFMLWHGRQLVAVMRATPSEVGTVALDADLSREAPLGAYRLTIGPGGTEYPVFKVERFETPLLNLRVTADAEAVYAGSSARGQVRVHHAGMVPAVGVPVTVRVYAGPAPETARAYDPREDFFCAAPLVDYPEPPSNELQRLGLGGLKEVWKTEGPTAADGSLTFSFDTERGEARRYVIVAMVKSLAGRWEAARAEVLSSRLPLFLSVEPERGHYYPGETLRASVRTRALDGRPLSAVLRLFVSRWTVDGRKVSGTEELRTDRDGEARIAVQLGTRAPAIAVGVQTGEGWSRQPVNYELRQIGAGIGDAGLALKVDRKTYYPGETARVTIEVDRPGADVFVTVSREDVLRTMRVALEGVSGSFDLPVGEGDAPNVYLHAVAVRDDQVRRAALMLPVIPAHRFLKVEVLTDRQDYAGGDAVAATVKVTDSRGRPARNVEVSLAAVRSSTFTVQEDLTPDLARYFLNCIRPLLVTLGESALASDDPRVECYWLRAVFAWGIYEDLGGKVEPGGLAGCFGFRDGAGRRRLVGRYGGSSATERAARELFVEFLRQHGLTLFWESRLVTDEKGEARAEFLLPPDGGEFRFTARAVSAETFVGELRKSVRYRRELMVQAPWPLSVREGELVRVPAFVVNGSAGRRRARLSLESDIPTRILAAAAELELAPGGVARVDIEIDAHSLPGALPGAEPGWQPPLSYARFRLICEGDDGRKAESRAVVPVRRDGIPVERLAVVVTRRGEGPRAAAFDLAKAVPGSVRLELQPLAGPARWAEWLRGRLDAAAPEDGVASAWAAEAGAERLAEADRRAGRRLPIGRELMRAFAGGIYNVPDERCGAYLLACASAAERGVALPSSWPEAVFNSCCGRLDQATKPEALWGLAVWAAQSPERLAQAEKIAARLESLRSAGVESAADWACLAMAFAATGRSTKASWCLDKGLFAAGLTGGESAVRPDAGAAAAMLLAGVRLELDAKTMGRIYAAILDGLADNPRVGAWQAALAVQALTEWGRVAGAQDGPVKASIGTEKISLPAGATLVRVPAAGRNIEVSVAEPAAGAVGLQVRCSYRVLHSDLERDGRWRIQRRFARITPEGHAELLEPGGTVRIGEALLMTVHTSSNEAGWAHVPLAGPWPATAPAEDMPITRRVRRQFVLDRPRRARVMSAVEDLRLDQARAEIIAGVEAGDFVVETLPVAPEARAGDRAKLAGRADPAVFRADQSAMMLFRPDRTGTFIAPATWLARQQDGHPAAAAEPFAFNVVGADQEIPSRQAEVLVADWLRTPLRDALRLTSDSGLLRHLEQTRSEVDARSLAMDALLRSGSSRAPALYAQMSWGRNGLSLDEISELVEWRKEQLLRGLTFDRGQDAAPGRPVLARALSSTELLERVVAAPDFKDDPLRAYAKAAAILSAENEYRRALYDRASLSPAADGLELRPLRGGEIVPALPPERLDALLDSWDEPPAGELTAVRSPSLRKAISGWAAAFGLEVVFAPDVPDLEPGEYVLRLPAGGSTVALDRSLRSMALRARRTGRSVRVWLDRNLADGAVGAVMTSGTRTAEDRLKVFLDSYMPGEAGLAPLLTRSGGASTYSPRVRRSFFWPDSIKDLKFDPHQPLSSQLHLLGTQGLRVDIKDGVLRFVRVD